MQESKINTGKEIDVDLVLTESSGTESEVQDNSSMSGNDTNADDANIRPIYDEEPMAETIECAKSKRPQMSKPRFASLVDVNNNLLRPATQHYLPKRRESIFAKHDHMIASSESRNSFKNIPGFRSNDMVHNHYLDEARKKTQERDRNSKTSVTPFVRFQSNVDDRKPKPRSTYQSNRSLPVKSHKTRNSYKPVEQKSHTQQPGRQIFTGHSFSPNKTFVVCEKTSPISDLRWKPTGRIFKSVSLRWIPTGKLFDCCTSKDDSEPPHGSNVDILNIHKCKQTLDVSAEYFNGENQVVSKSSAVTTTDASDKRQQQPNSTSSTSALATTINADGSFDRQSAPASDY
uniref:Uncharacterized protein n=1 Tax=Tanacetum cinerariifolium TaxID=118510 RepID=A0A6L2LMQ2_TANCI|nr:hypothetical protein [Tanacetum cinerariifolium]